MKIKTQVIYKVEDVRFEDIVVDGEERFVVAGLNTEDAVLFGSHGEWFNFNKCTVVRITVESE